MTTMLIVHEVTDGQKWANAWKKGPGSRHELFGKLGIKCRTFRDATNPNLTGILDLPAFQAMLASPEGKKAMAEDGLKVETLRTLVEFTP